jgi:hypothetical protein
MYVNVDEHTLKHMLIVNTHLPAVGILVGVHRRRHDEDEPA